jgi:hypothetical protein
MAELGLDADRVSRTAELLCRRVEQRFPGSGLSRVGRDLLALADRARERAGWIATPILPLRIAVGALILLIGAGLVGTLAALGGPQRPLGVLEFVQVLEAGINDVVLVGAGIFFLLTLETRIKRRRALASLRELRAIAHIIDMHQLTKDPEWVLGRGKETGLLPPRGMTRFELSRYLDYCSEMLSITGKIAALYIQRFDDDVALAAVNEVEDLTTGLSRKVWQKLMILSVIDRLPEAARATPADAQP